MKLDLFSKTVLSLIAACLLVLCVAKLRAGADLLPVAQASDVSKLNFTKDGGVGIACSQDGKYVYVAGTEGVVRSTDYGRVGSWEKVIKED